MSTRKRRVVVTGIGVCAPGALSADALHDLLLSNGNAIEHFPELQELNFGCQLGAKPAYQEEMLAPYFDKLWQRGLKSAGMVYAVLSGMEAWKNAGLEARPEQRDPQAGMVFGAGVLGVDKLYEAFAQVDQGNVRRLGSTTVLQTMTSGASAYLAGLLGCGNRISANSSACSTGTEAVILGADWIKQGKAKRMLVGSTSEGGPYVWGGFDAMRVLPRSFNDKVDQASRPMSATAAGFVPSCGAGALVLEDLDTATERGATIYAEYLSGSLNAGGQREGGSLTAPNPKAVRDCIRETINKSGLNASEINAINGHLTATKGDVAEIAAWTEVFAEQQANLPPINSFKGHLGHALAASGSIELVACVNQLKHQVIYGNRNCVDLHPEIAEMAGDRVLQTSRYQSLEAIIKASFGFGDVNASVIFKKWSMD
ncbi:beta-ketoacyl-[acyl-carrier-protein] synthase family protein [Aureicoccus marinus]|uniref:3-oxoacyl-[acyl-carrier-protein] synthase 1 n=1 Tax=Aureicoccus marinus TaxID=754435 RepID=A0A2S7T645_9FLAO|nr:beta-ketoacyl-[acyl-carrier-protein] synthase family protein [Aureicoccus marinus]PQJ14997.1 beta-ketoacyl-ACP synthase [Aureicoccus marinus]